MRLFKKDVLSLKFNDNKSYCRKNGPKQKKISFDMSFLKEFWEFLKIRKILAFTNYNCSCDFWWINCANTRISCSSIYLHNIL